MRNFNGDYNNGQGAAIQGQLDAIRNQLNDNQNANLLRDAIGDGFNRNDFALSQLAQNLNVDFNTLQKSCCDVQAAIQQVCWPGLVSLLNALSMRLTLVIATLSRLFRTAAARLSVRLQTSALIFSFRTVKTPLNFCEAKILSIAQ